MSTEKQTPIMIFRDRVNALMKEKKMTQAEFANHCDLPHSDIANLSRKQTVPTDVMLAVADKCDVSTDWLLGRTDIREVARSKEEGAAEFDYSKVTYGDLNRMLAFAAACGILQIVPPKDKNDNVSLLVRNKDTADFLRRLQKKAIDVITDSDETEYLTDWFEKKCAIMTPLSFADAIFEYIDKYHGAFPWHYICSLDDDLDFDFTDAEWLPYTEYAGKLVAHDPYGDSSSYNAYLNLCDGITGYYGCDRTYFPKPPHDKKAEQKSTIDGFMNIPDGIDDELPFN